VTVVGFAQLISAEPCEVSRHGHHGKQHNHDFQRGDQVGALSDEWLTGGTASSFTTFSLDMKTA